MRFLLPSSEQIAPDLCSAWVALHAVEKERAHGELQDQKAKELEVHLKRQLKEFSEIQAPDWKRLLEAQGVSPVSLTAYSWCSGANLSEMIAIWGKVFEAAKVAEKSALRCLRFTNPALMPEAKVSALLKSGFLHGWQMTMLSHIWADRDVIHDVNEVFKPEIEAMFCFVKPYAYPGSKED